MVYQREQMLTLFMLWLRSEEASDGNLSSEVGLSAVPATMLHLLHVNASTNIALPTTPY